MESSLQLRLEASRESWKDEEAAERQRGSFEERWGDEEGAESSLHGRLEASKERRRDEEAAEMQEPSRIHGEMRRGQRVGYMGD